MILDVGCGKYCRGDVGMDISLRGEAPSYAPEAFDKYARGRNMNPDLVLADANFNYPFRNGTFDEVYFVHCLEHLLSPHCSLMEAHRVLRAGGKTVVIVPNAVKNVEADRRNDHYFSFTIYTIERLMSKVFSKARASEILNGDDIICVGLKG